MVSLYFSLRWVSLVEYFLVLRVLFLLCRWSDVLWLLHQLPIPYDGRQLEPRAWSFRMSYLMLFLEMTIFEHCIWTKSVCSFKTICFHYFIIKLVCNNFIFKLLCISVLLRTLCNIWLWLLNLYDLGLYVGWFKILRGFTDYRVIQA
jgi:hypothetical protein